LKGDKMKIISLLFTSFLIATGALALEPAKITCTNFRGEAVSDASADAFYRGDVIKWTNCVMYSGMDTNSAKQDLTGLTIILTWGDTVNASTCVTGVIQTATSGVWGASTTLRTTESAKTFFEIKLTNTTDVFGYPFKTITTKSKL